MDCEALAPGVSFEVTGKKKKSKKRFFIESIESRDTSAESSLFMFQSSTKLVFPGGITEPDRTNAVSPPNRNGGPSIPSAAANGPNGVLSTTPLYQLDVNGIGGLLEECRALNERLGWLLARAEDLDCHPTAVPTYPMMLHGCEGTGKSMLMKKLSQAPFRKVLRIDRNNLPGGTISANKKFIKESFAEAISEQPALIILDNLDQLAPSDDTHYSDVLALELENASKPGNRVMIVGACRSQANIHSSLLGPGRFSTSIELPIPNLEAREQIMNVLQEKPAFTKNAVSTAIAEQTHGYTAKDLVLLHIQAKCHAFRRFRHECAERDMARSPTPPAYEDIVPRLDGSAAAPSRNRDGQPSSEPNVDDFKIPLHEIKPTALREIFTEKPTTRWTDIGGSDSIKERFDKAIEWPLKHKDLMLKMGISSPKGVLLYGPPGCSKTLTAQAVANTYKLNFIAIKGAELISMYVGESERAVREVFRKAKRASPCIIFFDEIDSIGSERDSTGTKGLNVLTTLLNEMDGFEALKDVFILAATNKPAHLDPALLRPGRFDSHVYVGPPGESARKEIITLSTRGAPLAKDVNFDHLAAEMEGYSGAEIVRICHNAKESSFEQALKGEEDVRVSAADFASARAGVKKAITKEMLEEFEAFTSGVSQD